MPVTLDQSGAVTTVRLEGEVDISAALGLKAVLLDGLASGADVNVDLTGANQLDITILQLLWAAQRAAGKAGVVWSIRGHVPDEIVLAMDQAGLKRLAVDTR